MKFDWDLLTVKDRSLAYNIIDSRDYDIGPPDLVIAPAGESQPYIYRWHIVKDEKASVYFHIQVASDPERPLHDHPWDNTSVILSGGYDEILDVIPEVRNRAGGALDKTVPVHKRREGDMIHRKAEWAHRLLLPPGFRYTLTLFMCGPRRREWGFWYPDGWRAFDTVTEQHDGVSVHKKPTMGD